MSWFAVDDMFPDHPKLADLEEEPKLWAEVVSLWLSAGCWCRRHPDNRGRIPKATLRRVVPFKPQKAARALVSVGLWLEEGKSYLFHDWNKYQPDKDEISRKRSEAGKRGAEARWGKAKSDGKQDGKCHAVANGKSHAPGHVPNSGKTCPNPTQPNGILNSRPATGNTGEDGLGGLTPISEVDWEAVIQRAGGDS